MNLHNYFQITQTAATVAAMMQFPAPKAAAEPNPAVVQTAERLLSGKPVERCLLYNPDAIGLWLYQKYTAEFIPVITHSQVAIPVNSVMPSVTPVCFASMYTGVTPDVHGIQAYVKPVLKIETLFDAAIAAGKKPIIISTAGDSITQIFLEREMDYIVCQTPDECNERALEVLKENRHDIVVVYNANYDSQMHRSGPEAPETLAQLTHNANAFAELTEAAAKAWKGMAWCSAFLPDHGCHEIDGNLGSHGLDMPEDMDIVHFYGFHQS